MAVRIGVGLSDHPDPRVAGLEAAAAAARRLGGGEASLVVAFASGTHLEAPAPLLDAVHEVLAPEALAGCGASGVLGDAREVEDGTAVVVWAADLGGGRATSFAAHVEDERLTGLPPLDDAAAVLLFSDPLTFPTDPLLRAMAREDVAVPVLGGLSGARRDDGTAVLLHDDRVLDEGAVGVRLDDVEVHPCVSQGAAPLGPELAITACEGNVIRELAGRPALARIREAVRELPLDERRLVADGLLVGLVVDGNKPEYERGDFLVRGVLGADPRTGGVAVGARVEVGQVVRLHARDAASADADLRDVLARGRAALDGAPAGALVVSCNGRGAAMFGAPDHDAAAVDDALDGLPAAGFFAAGEIGPVGGESHLHGFTATVALFGA